jgi:predicted flap endonuclease-1-like 5' DNA nuclease
MGKKLCLLVFTKKIKIMFENTFQGPGAGTYIDHTIEILLMLLVAFLLGLLLGYILWYKWNKLYQELNAEHNRLKALHVELEKDHVGVKYKLEECEKDNSSLRRKIMSLEGDVTGLRFRLEKCESDMAVALAGSTSGKGAIPAVEIAAATAATAFAATAPNPIPAPTAKDDLKKVEGIGPKIEKICNESGIWTFAELASTSVERLNEILEAAGPAFRIAEPDTWPQQAALAAAGSWDELKKYQDFLSGGKTPGA